MPRLKDKIENALNEARILVLGGQVLIGSSYRAAFSVRFGSLSHSLQNLRLISLVLMLAALGILLVPASYHRIVEDGENSVRLHRVVTRVLEFALFPFAIGLGVDAYTVSNYISNRTAGLLAGTVISGLAIGLWYVFAIMRRNTVPRREEQEPTTLTQKIKEVLIEARMILPGAQALLGFQVSITLADTFDRLPQAAKWLHLVSLLSIAICTIFLIGPAAYHRIALNGEDSEAFYRLCGTSVMVAMFWLGLGVCGDLFVVAQKTTNSGSISLAISLLMLLFFYAAWFGYTYYKSRR